MFLKLTVYDNAQKIRGSAQMRLDWGQKTWFLEKDPQQTWQYVGFSGEGSFERKPWGVIWLWDQGHNTVIIRDAPVNEFISKGLAGVARISQPRDLAFKDGKIVWTIDRTRSPGTISPWSALRENALKLLKEILPAPYLSPNYTGNPYHVKKPGPRPGYTTCGEFPAYLVYKLGDRLSPGTTALQPGGDRRNAWVDADGQRRPFPGDLYALCSGPTRDHTVGHVGVIVDSSGTIWKTADWGQGDGFSGDFVNRAHDPVADTLAGEVDPKKGNVRPPRAIKGWVDLDLYFANSKAKG